MCSDADLPLTPDDVADIVALLDGSAYQTLELSTPRFVLKVARAEGGGWTQDWRHAAAEPAAAEPVAAAPQQGPASAPGDGLLTIRAPLPGVFYRTPSPGAPPFVETGDTVGPDTVIGIIETMKVMNSILAGVSGRIQGIQVQHGEMVEQEAILMRLHPAGAAR